MAEEKPKKSYGFGEEFARVELGDKRLNKRAVSIAESLGSACHQSIPEATDGRAEMEAVYRFANNPRVTAEDLMAAHREMTLERIDKHPVLVMVQDTTEVDLTRTKGRVKGAGPLSARRVGFFLHHVMAFSEFGTPLGIVKHIVWVRKKIGTGLTETQRRAAIRRRPIEEKESRRWLEGLHACRDVARACPHVKIVCVADSESDIYEYLKKATRLHKKYRLEFIVRSAHNRNVETPDSQDSEESEENEEMAKLYTYMRSQPVRGSAEVEVSERRAKTNVELKSPRKCSREYRRATVQIHTGQVTLCSPRNRPKGPSIVLNAVLVEEKSPPKGQPPVQWLLLTSLPVDRREDWEKVIQYYRQRWYVEIYHRTLKTGCRIEDRYFRTMKAMRVCLALYMVIAWRLTYLCWLGRECPDIPCDVVFTETEWKSIYTYIHKKTPPTKPPTLKEMIHMIAKLGGYKGRASPHPGVETLWRGLQKVPSIAVSWVRGRISVLKELRKQGQLSEKEFRKLYRAELKKLTPKHITFY